MTIKALLISIAMLTASFSVATAQTTTATTGQSSTGIVGKWTGTYEGSDSGKFEMVLNQDSNQKLTGQIIMLAPDGNRYPIDLKTVLWQNDQLKAAYSDPQSGGDVSISGKTDGAGLKGTWDANGGQATGTWQLARADR